MRKVLTVIMVLMAYAGVSSAGVLEQASLMAGDKAEIKMAAVSMPEKLAGDRLSDLPGATAFDKLKALFEEGVPATKEDLTGWHAGRNVVNSGKDIFKGALLVGKDLPTGDSDGGPLFDDGMAFKVFVLTSKVPGNYDNMSGRVVSVVKEILSDTSFAVTLKFPAATATGGQPSLYEWLQYRKARGYVVEYFRQYRRIPNSPEYETMAESYAYYFKVVTPSATGNNSPDFGILQ